MTVKNFLTNLLTNLINEKIGTIKNIVIIADENDKLLVCDEFEKMLYSVVKEMKKYIIIDLQINSNDETSIFIIKCKKEANEQ